MFRLRRLCTDKKPITSRFWCRDFYLPNWAIFTMALAILTPAYAAEPIDKGLTLEEAVKRSLNSHPGLTSFGYRIKSAQGDIQQSSKGERAHLSLSVEDGYGSGEYSGFDNAKSTLGISWALEGSLLDSRVLKSEARKSLVEIEQDIKRANVAAETARQFVVVLSFQERLVIATKARQHSHEILSVITKRVRAGKAPLADQLRAEVNRERHELEFEDIGHELKAAKKVLASMWGEVEIDFSFVLGALEVSDELIEFEQLETAINNNPEIRYFIGQQRLTESAINLAKQDGKSRLRVNAGLSRYERTEDYSVSLGVTIPLGSAGRNFGKVSALLADKSRYKNNAGAKELELLTKVFVEYEELKHSLHIHESLETKIIPRLERALEETYKAYELGKYSYQEWSTVQQEVLDAQLAHINADAKAHNNTIELERLTGLALLRKQAAP